MAEKIPEAASSATFWVKPSSGAIELFCQSISMCCVGCVLSIVMVTLAWPVAKPFYLRGSPVMIVLGFRFDVAQRHSILQCHKDLVGL